MSAFVGWGTNVLAVQMMFYPIEFVGIQPWIGWQGIIPANAIKLAAKSTEVITTKLINLKMLFENFSPEDFAGGNLGKAMDEITDQLISETASKYAPEMWANMADSAKVAIRQMMRAEVEKITIDILADVSEHIEEIIDLKAIVMATAERDRRLMSEMFQRVGSQEFIFIKRSGAYFGFLFGLVQMVAWVVYPAWWVLPFFGFLVGYATNLLAIKLIFQPAEPTKVGPFTIQGLFHKRQNAVAEEFSSMVSADILNPDNMVAKMITGTSGEVFFGIVDKHIGAFLDKFSQNPMAKSMVPEGEWEAVRKETFARLRDELPKPGGFLHTFTGKAVDVYGELAGRMTELDSKSFEGILRPPFQEDEWKLIVAGAVLGLGAGILQLLYLFS